MNKKIVFRGMDHDVVLEGYINDQLAKLERFLEKQPDPKSIEIVVEKHPSHAHNKVTVNLMVHLHEAAQSHRINSHKEGIDLNTIADEAINCAYHELLNYKQKLVDDRRKTPKHQDVE